MSAKLSSSLVMRQPLFFSRGPSCSLLIIPRGRKKYALRSNKFVAKTVSLPLSNSQVLPRLVILTHTATFVFFFSFTMGQWFLSPWKSHGVYKLTRSQRFISSFLYEKDIFKIYIIEGDSSFVFHVFHSEFPKSNLQKWNIGYKICKSNAITRN